MNVSQAKLNQWAQFAARVKTGTYVLLDAFNTGNKPKFVMEATKLHDEAISMEQSIQECDCDTNHCSSTASLNVLDTPLNRDFARVLEIAADAALVVDHERKLGNDEGSAPSLFLELARVRAEITGPNVVGEHLCL